MSYSDLYSNGGMCEIGKNGMITPAKYTRAKKRAKPKHMYNENDLVKYRTSEIRTIHNGITPSVEKTGKIIEKLTTPSGEFCYWIEEEKELIFENQIVQ